MFFVKHFIISQSQPEDWKPPTLLESVLQRYLAENFPIIEKELPYRTHVRKPLWWNPFY